VSAVKTNNSFRAFFNAGCIVMGLLLFAMWAWPVRKRAISGENDFLQLYAGGRLVGTPELYDYKAHERIHVEVSETHTYYPSIYFTRLPFYALFLSPLARLPYKTAYLIWQSVSFLAVFAFIAVYTKEWPETVVMAALSVPLLINFTNGQDVGLCAALVGFAFLVLRRGHDFAAGLLLSLCSIKFHLFILVPVAVIIHKRWKLLQGGFAGGACLWALSIAAAGFGWPKEFLSMATSPGIHLSPERMTTFRNLVFLIMGEENIPLEMLLNAAGACLAAYIVWRVPRFEVAFGVALVAGLLVAHHAYSQDLLLLLVAAILFATGKASKALLTATVVVALPPTAFLLLSARPWSTLVPLMILGILVVALAVDSRRQSSTLIVPRQFLAPQ
jgi:hypothetical protein